MYPNVFVGLMGRTAAYGPPCSPRRATFFLTGSEPRAKEITAGSDRSKTLRDRLQALRRPTRRRRQSLFRDERLSRGWVRVPKPHWSATTRSVEGRDAQRSINRRTDAEGLWLLSGRLWGKGQSGDLLLTIEAISGNRNSCGPCNDAWFRRCMSTPGWPDRTRRILMIEPRVPIRASVRGSLCRVAWPDSPIFRKKQARGWTVPMPDEWETHSNPQRDSYLRPHSSLSAKGLCQFYPDTYIPEILIPVLSSGDRVAMGTCFLSFWPP